VGGCEFLGNRHDVAALIPSFAVAWVFRVSPRNLKRGSIADELHSHIHVSIQDAAGKNIFALSDEEIKAGGRADAKWKDTRYISKTAEHFLAGILDGIADGMSSLCLRWMTGMADDLEVVMPLLCPNINSYKRLVGGEASPAYTPRNAKLTSYSANRHSGRRTSFHMAMIPVRLRSVSWVRLMPQGMRRDSKYECQVPMYVPSFLHLLCDAY
jgi:hypothetical protein